MVETTLPPAATLKTGDVSLAQPSPDGRRLLTSDAHFKGLVVVDVTTRAQTALSDDGRDGFKAGWAGDDVVRRVRKEPFGGQPLLRLNSKTGDVIGMFTEHKTHAAVQTDNDVIMFGRRVDDSGRLHGAEQLSPAGLGCFAPQMATRAHDAVVVFQCLGQGVWLNRLVITGNTVVVADSVQLGAGNAVSLAADGRTLVFTVGIDDGHNQHESDVVLVDLDRPFNTLVLERATTAGLEEHPGVSNVLKNGHRVVAFVSGEQVVVSSWTPKK
jgi:hypothetical protein